MLLPEVIPPDELGVTFDHIGALDNVKETLRELVMLPLQRPELFVKGQLTKVRLLGSNVASPYLGTMAKPISRLVALYIEPSGSC